MDGAGCALDSIFRERLWRDVEYGNIYLSWNDAVRQLHTGLTVFFRLLQPRKTTSMSQLSRAGGIAVRALMSADRPLPIRSGRNRLDAPVLSCLVVHRSGLTLAISLLCPRGLCQDNEADLIHELP